MKTKNKNSIFLGKAPKDKKPTNKNINVGAKVKCITRMSKGDIEFTKSINYKIPQFGATYTVRGIDNSSNNICYLLLEEIKNPNFLIGQEMGYFSTSFKLLSNTNTPNSPCSKVKERLPDFIFQNVPEELKEHFFYV